MTESTRPTAAATPRVMSTTRTFWWAFAALVAVFGAWLVANPLTAAPDEPAHITKAGGVVRGELTGTVFDSEHPGWGEVDVPAAVGFATQMPNCFAFHPDVTAACMPAMPADAAATTQAVTTASSYNPAYYAIVGLPSLVPTGTVTVYLMRGVSALLCALALAWGFAQAAGSRRPDLPVLGVLLAMTPMVVYMSSAVNPASLETTIAIALWAGFSVLVRDPDPTRLRSRVAGFAILASLFVNLRGLSPLFLAAIVVTVAISVPLRHTWDVIRDRRTWPWMALLAIATLLALAWTRSAGTLDSDGLVHHPDLDFWTAVQWSLGDTSAYLTNMVGQFGWVDTALPWWLLMTIGVTIGFVVLAAVAVGTARERTALLLLVAFCVVAPVVIHASQAKYLGIVWQGRYFLPAAVGLPVLSGFVLARAMGENGRRFAWRTSLLLSSIWTGYQVCAFAINWHRYARGTDSGWIAMPPDAWSPPVPVAVLAVVLLAGLAGLVALSLSTAPRERLDEARMATADAVRESGF